MFDNYSMQNFDDYFIQEEFIFPEHGGVTGTRNVGCPCCEARYELAVDEGNTADAFRCDSCGNTFEVDWVDGSVRHKVPLNGPGYSGNLVTIIDGDGARMEIQVDCDSPEAEAVCRKRLTATLADLQAQGRIKGFAEPGN